MDTDPTPQAEASTGNEEVNEVCVGPQSEDAGKASSCEGCPNQSACASGEVSVCVCVCSSNCMRECVLKLCVESISVYGCVCVCVMR
jgi:hypothetical protein